MDGSEGTMITRAEAQQLMTNYRGSNSFTSNDSQVGVLFGKNNINQLLNQTGCVGVRIYYGKNGTANDSKANLILVGTDSNGNDITNLILDAGLPCPTECSSQSTRL